MSDPAGGSAVVVTMAWLSALSIAMIGVDYYAIVWALAGALVALAWREPDSTVCAGVSVAAGTVTGAALGHVGAELVGGSRQALVAASFTIGLTAQPIAQALAQAVSARIRRHIGDEQ